MDTNDVNCVIIIMYIILLKNTRFLRDKLSSFINCDPDCHDREGLHKDSHKITHIYV